MKKLLLSVLLVMAVFSLTACNGSEESAQGVTETTVTVGNSAATSGALAFVGLPFNAGIEAYFEMVNDEGGVSGRTIEFKHYDDEFNGAKGLTYAEKLVEDDQIFSFVGHFGTPIIGATETYLTEMGIPRVYYATGVGTLFNPSAEGNERASFPVQPLYPAEGQVMVARAIGDFNASKIGVIYSNDDSGTSMLEGIELEAEKNNVELEIVEVEFGAADLSAAAIKIVEADVDFIIIAANQGSAATSIKALEVAGSDVDCITSYVNASPSFGALIAETLDSFDVYASAWVDILNDDASFTEEYQLFRDEMEEYNSEYVNSVYAMTGWIAAHFFVEGLTRVGDDDLTWENYINAMESDPIKNPFGGNIDYSSGQRVGTQAMALTKLYYTPATDSAEAVYLWDVEQPIQSIDSILGK
ncbi:ABC transporter substrate-binding protein [Mycoplasmatota bacterium]|nr:ABC transporter substrate-binding protein [Mycoplasmatota bacterium]